MWKNIVAPAAGRGLVATQRRRDLAMLLLLLRAQSLQCRRSPLADCTAVD
jgi:hypothetical protein